MSSSSALRAQGSVGNATRLRILPRAQNPEEGNKVRIKC